MKLIANVEKKTLRILENERSIFRGEYGADKLELYINKQLENEYPTITALLSNGRKIGPYSTDDTYITEEIDGEQYTKATFTLSKANGFTLSEGKMQITIWMNNINGNKQALGNVILNVINTTAFDDGDIIVSGDVEGTIVNYKVELENLQGQVNGFNATLNNLQYKTNLLDDRIARAEQYKAEKSEIPTKLSQLEKDIELGVSEEDVMEIVEDNSQEVDTISIGSSNNYDITSDNEIPTTKAVKTMLGNVGGGSSSGDSVKVADMIVNVNDDMGTVSLSIENCPSIDFYKSFRIEIYDNNQLKEDWVFTAFDMYFEFIEQTVLCQDIINQTYDIYENIFDIFSLMTLSNEENHCFCEINFYQSYLENLSNLTAKIYYYEANKTTRYFWREM